MMDRVPFRRRQRNVCVLTKEDLVGSPPTPSFSSGKVSGLKELVMSMVLVFSLHSSRTDRAGSLARLPPDTEIPVHLYVIGQEEGTVVGWRKKGEFCAR